MASTRLETLKSMLAQNPNDAFARYGLAMEYKNSGAYESAMREFHLLIEAHPDYPAGYFHGGQTLERMGCPGDARAMYRNGVDAAARKGDAHAKSEMQAALDLLD